MRAMVFCAWKPLPTRSPLRSLTDLIGESFCTNMAVVSGVILPTTNVTVFVDCTIGDDANDGLVGGVLRVGVGPMKTIQAALKRTRPGDTVSVAGGIYHGDVDLCGLDIEFVITGDVTLTD